MGHAHDRSHVDERSKKAWQFVIESTVPNSCLVRWDSRKRSFVQTDFCSKGMGFVCMQPANDWVSIAAMYREMARGECEFWQDPPKDDKKKPMPSLRPIFSAAVGAKVTKRTFTPTLAKAFQATGAWENVTTTCGG